MVISWENVTTDERIEGDRLVRERKEKQYVRTLPLPGGTKVGSHPVTWWLFC